MLSVCLWKFARWTNVIDLWARWEFALLVGVCSQTRECTTLYRHVWSLIMRKDQKAMMSLLCSHMRKLCANDACMFRHVSLHDHFLACRWHCCQAPAGWGWHRSYDGDRHSLRARYISVWLFVWNVIVHVLDYGASIDFTHCVKKCWCREKEFVCFWVWYNKWFDTMCEESCVAVRKYLRQQGVRSSFGRAMLSSLFCLDIMLKRATFHLCCYAKIFGDIGDLAMLVTFACDTCVWRLL